MSKVKFISVEGIEGVGKSTAIQYVESLLKEAGLKYTLTREPGGTKIAEKIRAVLLSEHEESMCSDTELLLMFATRAQNLAYVIKPALARHEWVVSDRFHDASFAYQGGGRGIEKPRIRALSNWVLGDFKPDLTLLLDAPVEVGQQRMVARGKKDRIEAETVSFFNRVREAYLDLAKEEPERFVIIDASQSLESVQKQIKSVLQKIIEESL